jgi:alpha-N-arabinofuranosidase
MALAALAFAGVTVRDGADDVNKITLDTTQKGAHTIAPEIYGQFAEHLGRCVYEGFWVGEDSDIPNTGGIRNDVVEALKKMKVPVLRWPGGCFADEYHWKDGIGPRDERPSMVNTHWGMVTDDNAFGTHEFMALCEMLGCEAYIAGNVGSGTPEEMQDWIEYMTFAGKSEMADLRRANGREKPWKVKFFGVGNENWGCGGEMTADYYSNLYRRYQTYVRNYPGNRIVKVACGPGGADMGWLDTVMKNCERFMDAITMHYYVFEGNWGHKGSAVNFDENGWSVLMENTLRIDDAIKNAKEVIERYDRRNRVALYVDEWGTWWDAEEGKNPGFLWQQNTIRDAVSAAIFLNTFNNHCDRVKMSNIAQINNVLQAMILTDGEKMLLTPTYHVFEMFNVHQGAELIPLDMTCNAYINSGRKLPQLSCSASKDKAGKVHITICNLDPLTPAEIEADLGGLKLTKTSGRVLTADKMNAHNTFEHPDAVKPSKLGGLEIKGGKLLATIPAKSVSVIELQ